MRANQSDVAASRQIMAVMLHLGHRLLLGQSCSRFAAAGRGNKMMQAPQMRMFLAVVLLASAGPIVAKEKPAPSPLVNAIDHCRQITDPTQRLACYDSAA